MNKQRRAEIADAVTLIEEVRAAVETAQEDEQAYFDNMPEAIQAGERGDAAQAAADALQAAMDALDEARQQLEEAAA